MKKLFTLVFIFTSSYLLKAQDTAFEQTVNLIQKKIRCCSVPFSASTKRKVDNIDITKKGDVALSYSDNKPDQTFNLLELYKEKDGATGIDTIMTGKIIQFYVSAEKIKMIRFASTADAGETYTAFLKLLRLCKIEIEKFNDHPAAALYFIGRNTVLNTENEILLKSIRSVNKKVEGDTTVDISSTGEGWLDKDSMPIGKWSFYAKDKKGKEYLFKSGTYHRTIPGMFEVKNIDSADLSKDYHLSFCTLQQEQVKIIPFIKTYAWQYYHPNGKLWKLVNYQVSQIPINTQILIQGDDQPAVLIIDYKENPDEWINTQVSEYDEQGVLIRKLE